MSNSSWIRFCLCLPATRLINGTVLAEPLITSVWIWSGLQLKIIPILSCLLQKCTRPGYTYTYRTLEELKEYNPDTDYYFIIGADSLFAFDEWMEPERICRACTLVVAVRDHASYAELNREIQRLSARYNGNFALLDTMNIDVSSHQIRQWISEEKSLKYYVPDKVISYMKENGIYRKKEV